ncbi:MAG: hypothetical protein QXG00_08125, partial [Candidatus Woesearchaeota archaeon]
MAIKLHNLPLEDVNWDNLNANEEIDNSFEKKIEIVDTFKDYGEEVKKAVKKIISKPKLIKVDIAF